MKVRICEDVQVETEVDVDFDVVMSELSHRLETAIIEDRFKLFLSVVDWTTRIIERLPADLVSKMTEPQLAFVRDRLSTLLDASGQPVR